MTMKPEVIAHFNQMADQLLAGLRSVTGITEFTRNTDVIGAFAESLVYKFTERIIAPIRISSGTIVDSGIPNTDTPQFDLIFWSPNPIPAIVAEDRFGIVPKNSALGIAEIKKSDYNSGLDQIESMLVNSQRYLPQHAPDAYIGIILIREHNGVEEGNDNKLTRLLNTKRVVYLLNWNDGNPTINYPGFYRLINFLGHIRSLDHVKKSSFRSSYPNSDWPFNGV